jgi:hypothetical protein
VCDWEGCRRCWWRGVGDLRVLQGIACHLQQHSGPRQPRKALETNRGGSSTGDLPLGWVGIQQAQDTGMNRCLGNCSCL